MAYSAPSHYLNRRWFILNSTFENKYQWNFKQNIFVHTNYETEMSSAKWRPFCLASNEHNVIVIDATVPSVRLMSMLFMKASCHGKAFHNTGPFVRGIPWLPVDFPHKESFEFFVVSLKKLLDVQSTCRWFERPWHSCGMSVMIHLAYIMNDIHRCN